MKVILTAIAGPLKGQVVEFVGPGSFLIGRAEEADYRLPEDDRCVSRRHIRMEIRPPKCRILDIGTTGFRSLNSPKVNGRMVDIDAILNDGDVLELGYSQFKITFQHQPETAEKLCPKCGGRLEYLGGQTEPSRCRTCHPQKRKRHWAEGTTVLAVEDDLLTAKLIRASLELEGLEVLEAGNGRDGLALLKKQAVDLVSTDLMMPGMDGFWLIREIRELTPHPLGKLPILVLSENAGEEDIVRCLSAGADDYMTKPLSPQIYIEKLWRLYLRSRS